ncbi:DUF1634 domain-containing protein [Candidatus Korobacter versatilis]|nr:DUF1634 domain-containing protein [Candidatus Koribacter versatilis]
MSDTRMEQIVGVMLRTGVLLAAFVVFVGGVMYLHSAAHQPRDFTEFHSVPEALKSIPGVLHGTGVLDAQSIIQLGLLLLIATPIARVLFSVGAFALERDWLYVVLTFVVLGVLLFSLLQSS